MTKKLSFVYNANSGALAVLLDGLHKNVHPSSYACQLCALSYGRVSMKKEWKEFTQALPYEVEFLHKDEFGEAYPDAEASFPGVFRVGEDAVEQVITPEQFDNMESLEDLKEAVQKL